MNRSLVSKRLVALAASTALVSSGAALASSPAVAAEGAIAITSAAAINNGGGLYGHIPVNCAVAIDYTDATPASSSLYEVEIYDQYGGFLDSQAGAFDSDGDPATQSFEISCDSFFENEPSTLVVTEYTAEGAMVESSAPYAYTFEYTDHPASISNSSVLKNGNWTNFAGELATISFSGGEWEPGTKFSTRIWTSKTKEFTPEDYQANVSGGAAIVDSSGADAPVLSWTPRGKDAGRWVWTSIVGQVPGKGAWTFYFAPEYVAKGTIDRTLVKNFGVKKGITKVGRTVKVTKPVLTEVGKAEAVKTTYKWYFKKGKAAWKPLKGAKSTKNYYKLTRTLKGKRVMVKATYRADGFNTVRKNFVFKGRV